MMRSIIAVVVMIGLMVVAMIVINPVFFPDYPRGDPRNATRHLIVTILWGVLIGAFGAYNRFKCDWGWLDFACALLCALGVTVSLACMFAGFSIRDLFLENYGRGILLEVALPVGFGWIAGGLVGSLLRWKWACQSKGGSGSDKSDTTAAKL